MLIRLAKVGFVVIRAIATRRAHVVWHLAVFLDGCHHRRSGRVIGSQRQLQRGRESGRTSVVDQSGASESAMEPEWGGVAVVEFDDNSPSWMEGEYASGG